MKVTLLLPLVLSVVMSVPPVEEDVFDFTDYLNHKPEKMEVISAVVASMGSMMANTPGGRFDKLSLPPDSPWKAATNRGMWALAATPFGDKLPTAGAVFTERNHLEVSDDALLSTEQLFEQLQPGSTGLLQLLGISSTTIHASIVLIKRMGSTSWEAMVIDSHGNKDIEHQIRTTEDLINKYHPASQIVWKNPQTLTALHPAEQMMLKDGIQSYYEHHGMRNYCQVLSSFITNIHLQNPQASVLHIQMVMIALGVEHGSNVVMHFINSVINREFTALRS